MTEAIPYVSEPGKILPKIQKYLDGVVYDVACGDAKIFGALGIDGRKLDRVDIVRENLNELSKDLIPADCIFSSHFLEHCPESYSYILDWSKIIKQGGYLILYLPDGKHYSHQENPEHLQYMEYETFMFWFRRVFCGEGKDFRGQNFPAIFEIVEHGTDYGINRYSFYLAAKKL